jgi:hypothetical protein
MFYRIGDLARQELGKIGELHLQHVVNEVGPISREEWEAKMGEAARIHADEWNRTAHPDDHKVPSEAHEWAVRHIAANLVARDRGYHGPARSAYPVRRAADVDLAPATRTKDWGY